MKIFEKKYWLEVFNPKDIIKTTAQTIVGTILIGSFFMVASDYIFPPPDLHGRWEFTTSPKYAHSHKHEIMKLTYTIRIFQEGNKFKGIGEKIKAEIPENELGVQSLKEEYVGKARTRIQLEGYIKNNYFSKDRIRVFYTEGGESNGPRSTATIQNLYFINDDELEGIFDSTISESMGKVRWTKKPTKKI
jgi:hypothetical protein